MYNFQPLTITVFGIVVSCCSCIQMFGPPRETPEKKVILWATLRSGSSSLARSFMQRNDTEVLFEWLHAYYYGPERHSSNYGDWRLYDNVTYESIWLDYNAPLPAGKTLRFIKDQAMYIVPYGSASSSFVWPDVFDSFQHTFLVRSPRLVVPSLVKVMSEEQKHEKYLEAEIGAAGAAEIGAPEGFYPAEIGMQQLHTLFHAVRNHTGTTPVLIDFNDLLDDPASILSEFCNRIGVNFEDGMLHWEAGWRAEFDTDGAEDPWVADVINSTGFRSGGSTERHKEKVLLPPTMKAGMEAAMPLYNELLSHKMSVPR